MGNWFTDTVGDVGDALASGIEATTRGLNVVDRYVNPFHVEFSPDGEVDESRDSPLGRGLTSGVEQFSASYEYVYSNYISQPLSTGLLMTQRPGEIFSASEWARTWRAAQYISPGQAMLLPYAEESEATQIIMATQQFNPLAHLLPHLGLVGDPGNADRAVDSPLVRYQPPLSALPPGWEDYSPEEQEQILADMGMPVDPRGGNAYIASLRDRSMAYKYISGVDDFTLRWMADPITGALKGLGAVKKARTTRSRPQGGWSTSDIDRIVSESRTQELVRFLDENRNNPALVANLPGMNPRYAAVNAMLRNPDEVRDFIRVGMGDIQAAERLAQSNAQAALRMEGYRSRVAVLNSNLTAYANRLPATAQNVIKRQVDDLNRAFNQDEALILRHEQVLEHADEIDTLHVGQWQYDTARNRTEAQRAYTAGAGRDRSKIGGEFRAKITPVLAPEGTYIPVATGIVKTRLWGVGDVFTAPVTFVRAMKNGHPNGRMDLDPGQAFSAENVTELRGQLARIPGMTGGQRQHVLNNYLKTASEGERRTFLDDLGRFAMGRIAEKHGLDPKDGIKLWEETQARRTGQLQNWRQYSATYIPGQGKIRVDQFQDGNGIALDTRPHTVSRLINSYILDDLDEFDKILRRHASMFRALRESSGSAADAISRFGDTMNQYWKFATLFRLGYIPRTISDELAVQVAALGAATMAMRTGYGVKNLVTNMVHRSRRGLDDRAAQVYLQGVRYADDELADLQPQLAAAAAGTPAHAQLQARITQLQTYRDLAQRQADDLLSRNAIVRQGTQKVRIGDQEFPAALAGSERGEYYARRIAPSQAYDQLLLTNQQMIHDTLLRSFDNGARPIDATVDEMAHATAWAHAINAQIAGDVMERMVVAGRTDADIVRWLKRDAAGRAYWRRLGLDAITTPEEIVRRARYEVDEYLPLPEIRAQALTPEGVTPEFLKDAISNPAHRPTVHMANVGHAGLEQFKGMNRVMQGFYDFAVNLPSKTFSRHPLFNQLYEGHLKRIVAQRAKQGASTRTVEEVERAAEVSRRLAERDMKKLVFDMTHRSDAAAALRFISPFFSATTESFQRWARIIAEKPEIVGYAAKFYNAPAYAGALQTANGDPIFADGHYIDPVTGERKLSAKSDRFIVGRLPDWLVDSPVGIAMGAERSSGKFMLSQNSINVVTQGDPWYNPGVGPIVAMPVGEVVKDKPKQAELMRHLGILPFGPPTGGSLVQRSMQSAAPSTIRNFLTAFDTSDYRYQQVKMQILQRAIYEHEENGVPMPSAQEIADRTRNYWLFTAASSFTQPAATQRRDAFDFYRQQYRNLQRANPETADVEFLHRFGEEYFIFAQSMSKNVAGVQATQQAVALSQQYSDLLSEYPELGSLIIGPEGNGPFSPEAYSYQLNQPLEPGDSESQRRRLSAREAMEENNRRLGWARYTDLMNYINAQLVQRGLVSLEDEGAEDLAAIRKGFVTLYAEPMIDRGDGQGPVANPQYNEQWSTDWYSFDARKYERLIPALDRVSAEMLERDPDRTDLRALRLYLAGRAQMQQQLSQREFTTLSAQANADLRLSWAAFVGQLVESDTTFGDLHSRYLARDLGVDAQDLAREEAIA